MQTGTCGSRSLRRLDFVRKMMIAIFRPVKFCWLFDTLIHREEDIKFGYFCRGKNVAIL